MSMQTDPLTRAPLTVGRVVPVAFVTQALVSLVVWFGVDDRPDMPALSNNDVERWFVVSLLSAALLATLGGVALRRLWVVAAVAGGCLLAVISACAVYVGYVVFNSA